MKDTSFVNELQDIQLKKSAECKICAKTADRIEQILQKRGMTHRDLANLLGKRESEISRWMSGKHNFTITTIADIEFALKESIIEFTAPTDMLVAAEQACMNNNSKSDEFIKSLQLRGGRKVPNNVNGIECLIEEKYIR